MKGQFTSTEELAIRFPPFINSTTGAEITGDAVTIVVRKPDNTTATYNAGTTPAVAYDATIGVWYVNIPTASFQNTAPYEWRVIATSNDVTALPQRKVYYWGDWVQGVSAIKAKTDNLPAAPANETTSTAIKAKTDLIPASPASEATSTAIKAKTDLIPASPASEATSTAIKAKTDLIPAVPAQEGTVTAVGALATAIKAKTDNLPAAPANEVTVEAARVAAVAAAEDAWSALRVLKGRFVVDADAHTLTLFDDDNVTPLYAFLLKDENGVATATRIFERVPV